MRARVSVLALVCAVGVGACVGRGTHIGVGYEVSNGAALLPPTTSRGTSTAVVYHEQGGPLARLILIVGAALGVQNPDYDVSSSQRTYTDGDYIVTETTTTYTPTSPEEKARREAANAAIINETIPGLAHDTLPVELDWAFYRQGTGGDTSGSHFEMKYQLPMTATTGLSIGIGLASVTYHQREVHDVMDMGMTLSSSTTKGDLTYSLVGMPVKITHGIANRLAMYLQWDLNLYSLIENQPSPFRFGLHYSLSVFSAKAFLQSDRFDPGATTVGLEAIVGF